MKSAIVVMCAAWLCVFVGAVHADDDLPSIDTYRFTWTVAKQGDSSLVVEKTQDRTAIRITGAVGDMLVAPADAVLVGDVLKHFDLQCQRLKDTDQKSSDKISAGKCSVTFRNDPESGLSVAISNDADDRIILDRPTAKRFADLLSKADKLAAVVDKKIQP